MVRLTRIYTKLGDEGETHLGDMSRVRKDSLRVHAFGEVDEANSTIGVARATGLEPQIDQWLAVIQNDMFDVGADLCTPEQPDPPYPPLRITDDQVARLEGWCDQANDALAPLSSFILPGGSAQAAALHVARAVTRRAERAVVALAAEEEVNPAARRYLNRLSDLLFILARHANGDGGDVLWVPGGERG